MGYPQEEPPQLLLLLSLDTLHLLPPRSPSELARHPLNLIVTQLG